MRKDIAILSDTHGELNPAIESVVAGCSIVIHAGDIGSTEVLERLGGSGAAVYAVAGNNDKHLADAPLPEAVVQQELPESLCLTVPGGTIAVEHGHRIWDTKHYHARLRARHPSARLIVYGHTHILALDVDADPWVVNPGAAGRIRTHGGPSCLVLHAAGDKWWIDEYRFSARRAPSRAA